MENRTEHHEIFGIKIHDISHKEVVRMISFWLDHDEQKVIATPNPEMILEAQKNHEFKKTLNKSDLLIADGVGLRFAISALTNATLTYRHTGVDLVDDLAMVCRDLKKHLVLFGGESESAKNAAEKLKERYLNLDVSAVDPGKVEVIKNGHKILIYENNVHVKIVQQIKPDVLLVALGHGKQEQFIQAVLPHLKTVKIAVGVGGSFESISGKKHRAPKLLRKIGMEWLWRLFIEPRRIKRIINAAFVFPIVVVWSTLKSRRFLKACKKTIPEIFRQLRGL